MSLRTVNVLPAFVSRHPTVIEKNTDDESKRNICYAKLHICKVLHLNFKLKKPKNTPKSEINVGSGQKLFTLTLSVASGSNIRYG